MDSSANIPITPITCQVNAINEVESAALPITCREEEIIDMESVAEPTINDEERGLVEVQPVVMPVNYQENESVDAESAVTTFHEYIENHKVEITKEDSGGSYFFLLTCIIHIQCTYKYAYCIISDKNRPK